MGISNPFATGAGAATRAATNATAARQGRASNLTTLIDQSFLTPQREQQTQDFMGALRAQMADNTDRGFATTSRQNKFATARQGLTGGRVDVDRQKRTLEDLFRTRIGNEAQVQDAGNNLRTADLGTRQSLINGAYGTADVGQDALRSLTSAQQSNANYMSGLLPNAAAGFGSDVAGAYSKRREMDAYRRGMGSAGGTGGASGTYAWNTPSFGGGNLNG